MVAATGVLVAAVYYVLNLRVSQRNQQLSLKTQELTLKAQQQASETRQAQLFMQIFDSFHSRDAIENFLDVMEMEWSDPEDYMRRYSAKKSRASMYVYGNYLEGIAVLVKRKLIDPEIIYDIHTTNITEFWEMYEPVIKYLRGKWGTPLFYSLVEYLAGEMASIVERSVPIASSTGTLGESTQ